MVRVAPDAVDGAELDGVDGDELGAELGVAGAVGVEFGEEGDADGDALGSAAAGNAPRPDSPLCDLKLSKAVSPATVPTRASRMRFMRCPVRT